MILKIVLGFFLIFWFNIASAQVAVIAHKSVPTEKITSAELFDYYSGENRQWNNGTPVIVLDLKPRGQVKDLFYKFLGKSTSRMKSIWMVNMLSGEGDPPESLESEESMLKKVAATPGSIGFVSESVVSDDVKVLAIYKEKIVEESDQ